MFTFTISYSEAMELLFQNYQAWWWNPNMSAHAVTKGLDYMSLEEMEEQLHDHVRIIEEVEGHEPGLFSFVRFKIVRDHELARPWTPPSETAEPATPTQVDMPAAGQTTSQPAGAAEIPNAFRKKRGA